MSCVCLLYHVCLLCLVCVSPVSCAQVLVHGAAEATNSLLQYCMKTLQLPSDKLFAPRVGETVDATTESHIYQASVTHMQGHVTRVM